MQLQLRILCVLGLVSTVWSVYTDHARTVNLFLLVLCIAGLTMNMATRWRKMNRRTRRILSWIYLIFLNFVYGYTISIREHRPFNASVFIGTVLLAGLLVALVWHPAGDDKKPLEDGSVGSRFMHRLDSRVRKTKDRHRPNT